MANIHTRRDARIPRTCLAVTLGIGLAAWAVTPAPTPAQALGLFGGWGRRDRRRDRRCHGDDPLRRLVRLGRLLRGAPRRLGGQRCL